MENFETFINLPHLMRVHPECFRLELTFQHLTALTEEVRHIETSSNPIELRVEIPPELLLMLGMQLDICLTSGFGELLIVTDRPQKNKVRLLMKAGKSYIMYISDQALVPLVHWFQKIQHHI